MFSKIHYFIQTYHFTYIFTLCVVFLFCIYPYNVYSYFTNIIHGSTYHLNYIFYLIIIYSNEENHDQSSKTDNISIFAYFVFWAITQYIKSITRLEHECMGTHHIPFEPRRYFKNKRSFYLITHSVRIHFIYLFCHVVVVEINVNMA